MNLSMKMDLKMGLVMRRNTNANMNVRILPRKTMRLILTMVMMIIPTVGRMVMKTEVTGEQMPVFSMETRLLARQT